ncbi:protein FAR1-RELATED SEQUENCE [Citrus sinensis]|nr:protein FAR1-RELATED SEQUENCE [Citrus sinensis]
MFEYYKTYGLQEGFPVMRRSCRKGDDGSLRYVTFTCGRNGKSKAKATNVLRLQPNQKIGCNAKIGGRLDILEINEEGGIKMTQSFKSIVVDAGGFENVSFLERDARNHVDKVRRLRLGEGDAIAIQRYFQKMQTENDGFYFSIDLDEEGRLKNVFWADLRSRATYKDFGDIVTFDTTYLTNKYDMSFAHFVGVNHHGQSILLGCGLISHEDIETFTWLFDTWLSCMSGCPPLGIITDQDKAMKMAIQIVFPDTRHRWCLWHLLKKVPEKLGRYTEYHAIRVSLLSVVYDLHTPVEFEEAWHDMLDRYDLRNNQWLNDLYVERNRWVPAFLKTTFWVGMSTTQRSESMNAFFDGCGGSEYEVIENDEKSREKTFRVIFEKDEGEIRCVCSMFEYKGTLCKHTIAVLSRNRVQLLPEKYILRRWRKDVRRFSSKVKVSYDARSSSIEHQRYREECTAFYDVAEVASKNEESHKNIMGWIEKAMKDVSLNVRCDGDDTTIDGGSSSNIQDPVYNSNHNKHPPQHAFSPPYYQYWMNYGPAHHVHLQHAPQQNFEEANQGEFSTNEPSM